MHEVGEFCADVGIVLVGCGEAGDGLVWVGGGVVCEGGTPLAVLGACCAKLRHCITSFFILLARDLSAINLRT